MDMLQTLLLRVRSLFGARSLERELDEELHFHVSMQMDANIRAGMSAGEARRRALAQFGGVDRLAEECRDVRTGAGAHLLARSIRLGARRLRREPSFVVPAVATLAIGIGALTAIFTLTDAVLLRPLPYPEAERIVLLRHTLPGWGIATSGQSAGTFAHYLAGATSFESLGAWFDRELSITEEENPERVLAGLVTPGVLAALGVQPLLGRTFNDDDGGGRSVVLSHNYWQARYAGDPAVIGRGVPVNGVEREIIGVLPPRLDFPRAGTQMLFGMGTGTDADGGDLRDLYMEAVGRLRPGVTIAAAEAELTHLVGTLPARYGDVTEAQLAESRIAPRLTTLQESITGDVRPALVLLLCTGFFVMLIALANVCNLVLVRAEQQRREIALERALGAGSGAIVLRFVAEYALLTLLGAAAGIALAWVAVQTRFGFDAWHIPRLEYVTITGRSLLLAGAAALLTTALLVTLGLMRTARVDVQATLKGSLQRVTSSRQSRAAQQALSAVQVALACALLVAAAVMVQSVMALNRVPLGFAPRNVLAFDVALPVRQYQGYTTQALFHDRLAEELRALPGVDAVGVVSDLPLTALPNWFDAPIVAPDLPRPDAPPMISLRLATADYFHAMGIPLLRGRTFESTDVRDDGAGVILSAAVARMLFGTLDVIGRGIELPASRTAALAVVGVVDDIRDATLTAPAAPIVYLPATGAAQLTDGRAPIPLWPGEMTFVVRSAVPPATLLPGIREALRRLDPSLPLAKPRTLDDIVASGSARARITAWLLITAAAAALLLGVVGIYGVIAYAVSRRTPELALRMALGASPRGVIWMVLRQGAVIGAMGVAAGILTALGLTRLLAGLLFEVSPRDAATFVLVPAAMLLVVLAASALPARRAARTNPARALTSA
jgi:putative ABC transport system permease protein